MSIFNKKMPQQQQQEEQEQQQQQPTGTIRANLLQPQNLTQSQNRDQNQDQDHSSNAQMALKIPEIVIEICRHLTVPDLASCLAVCKLWNTVAQHHLWRSVFIYQKSENFLVSLQPAQREAIRQNAQRIKTLGLVQNETVLVGCETCTQLEEIYFFGLLAVDRHQDDVELRDQAGEHEEDEEEGATERQLDGSSALDLIAQNPRLQKIHLFDIEVLTRLWTPTRLRLLRHHPSLRSITMMFASYVYDLYIIRKLVAYCPDTVQVLKITTFGGVILQSGAHEEIGDESLTTTNNQWRSLPQMRDLTIEMCLYPCEKTILLPLLRCCPNLTRLRLNTMFVGDMEAVMSVLMQESFRRSIKLLEFPNILQDPGYALLFMEGYRGLTSLTMRIALGYEPVLTGMIQHLGSTLEHIRLMESTTTVSSQQYLAGVDLILKGCRQLKSLRVDIWGNNTPGTGVAMDRLLESAEWGCKGTLEELASRIDNPRGDFDHWSYEKGVLLVVRLFEKLRMMPKLRTVDFVWGALWKAIPLEVGLKGIKASRSGMTIADVKWMGLSWE